MSSCHPPCSRSHTLDCPLAPIGALPRGFGYGAAAAARSARFRAALLTMPHAAGSHKEAPQTRSSAKRLLLFTLNCKWDDFISREPVSRDAH